MARDVSNDLYFLITPGSSQKRAKTPCPRWFSCFVERDTTHIYLSVTLSENRPSAGTMVIRTLIFLCYYLPVPGEKSSSKQQLSLPRFLWLEQGQEIFTTCIEGGVLNDLPVPK